MTITADNLQSNGRDSSGFAIGDVLRGERATLGRSLLDVQRDLRIKAAYIAAIEDADPRVFPNPGFIPGYVRAYARYLGLDGEDVYARFCAQSGFTGARREPRPDHERARNPAAVVFRPDFPPGEPRWRRLAGRLPLSALASVMVLGSLVAGLGYGGWTVLQNIQRVQFAPVEELPVAVASVEALPPPDTPAVLEPGMSALASPVAATALAELYRRQELEVPILAPRDGPIAALDPDRVGLLAPPAASTVVAPAAETPAGSARAAPLQAAAGAQGPAPAPETLAAAPAAEPPLALAPKPPALTVVAERAAWVRVYLADKTVLFERILETGETYTPPADVAEPLIWAGNSGSVYVRLGETVHGPLGSGTRSVRDVALEPKALAERYAPVEAVPETIAAAFAPPAEPAAQAGQVLEQPLQQALEQAAITLR